MSWRPTDWKARLKIYSAVVVIDAGEEHLSENGKEEKMNQQEEENIGYLGDGLGPSSIPLECIPSQCLYQCFSHFDDDGGRTKVSNSGQSTPIVVLLV